MTAWTAFYWDDYIGDTQQLSLLEHGAYIRLLAAYYASDGELSADRRTLYRLCSALDKSEQEAVDSVVNRYFRRGDDGGLRHDRCDREIAEAQARSRRAKQAAEKRWQDDGSGAAGANGNANGNADASANGNAARNADPDAPHDPHPHPVGTGTATTRPHGVSTPNPPAPSEPPGSPSRAPTSGAQPTNGRHTKRFDEFWAQYPTGHRKAKKRAREIWARKRLDDRADEIMADLARRPVHDDQWRQGYIPNPSTYLNQERWTDDYRQPAAQGARCSTVQSQSDAAIDRWLEGKRGTGSA